MSKANALLDAPLPDWLRDPIIPRFGRLGCFSNAPHQGPNHVLINEYRPGQGIMPHQDGPAYYPLVATVSLAAPIVLDLYEKKEVAEGVIDVDQDTGPQAKFRILQEPRSLLITTGSLYTQYLHGIADRMADGNLAPETICNWDLLGNSQSYNATKFYERQTRVSLTYRDVLKVAKLGNSIKFLNRGRWLLSFCRNTLTIHCLTKYRVSSSTSHAHFPRQISLDTTVSYCAQWRQDWSRRTTNRIA